MPQIIEVPNYGPVEFPDGMSDAEIVAAIKRNSSAPTQEPKEESGALKTLGNITAGLVRGAGSIGSTILAPWDMAKDALDGKGFSLESNRQRRADIDYGLKQMGAEPDSLSYQGGKLGAEIMGTAGVGGVLSKLPLISKVPALAESIATGGFKTAGGMPARIAGGAITGATTAGAVNPEETGLGGAIGGAAPVVVKAAGKIGSAIAPKVSQEVADLYEKAKNLGIDIPADRITNSKPMNAVASSLNYVPMSGRAGTEQKMLDQMNRALSRTFGQDSSNVTQALRKASSALGGEFDRVLSANKVKIDNQFVSDLQDVGKLVADELDPISGRVITNQIDNILAKAGTGEIDGQAAYNIKKTLDRIGNRNSNEAYYARELKKKLMDALNRSLPDAEAENFAKVRKQYGNMLELEGLAQNGAEGGISVGRLANLKHINNQELQDLADIAAQFVRTRENPHGAAQRVVLGGLGGAASIASPAAIPALAGGVAAARGLNSALNADWLKNAVLKSQPQGLLGGPLSNPFMRTGTILGLSNP